MKAHFEYDNRHDQALLYGAVSHNLRKGMPTRESILEFYSYWDLTPVENEIDLLEQKIEELRLTIPLDEQSL